MCKIEEEKNRTIYRKRRKRKKKVEEIYTIEKFDCQKKTERLNRRFLVMLCLTVSART